MVGRGAAASRDPQPHPTGNIVPKADPCPTRQGQGWAARLEIWDLLAKQAAEVLGVPAGSHRGRRNALERREGKVSLCSCPSAPWGGQRSFWDPT